MGLFNFKNKTNAPKVTPTKLVEGKTIYVIDTNIPLVNPRFYDLYPKGTIFVIPFDVVIELSEKKSSPIRHLAQNARAMNRTISDISDKGFGADSPYVEYEGYYFRIEASTIVDNKFLDKNAKIVLRKLTHDDHIVATAVTMKFLEPKSTVLSMSNDVDVRVKSNDLGVRGIRFDQEDVQNNDIYDAVPEINVSDEKLAEFYTTGIKELDGYDMNENSGFILITEKGKRLPSRIKDGTLSTLKFYTGQTVKGLKALNEEQHIAFDMLLDPNVKVMTIIGRAGTGKSLLSIVTALSQQDDKKYGTIRLVKDVTSMGGQDLGFLPGDEDQKLAGFRLSYDDSFDFIGDLNGVTTTKGDHFGGGKKQSYLDTLIDHDYVKFSSPTFMRGTSKGSGKVGDFIIIDEAQNITPMLLKGLVTRFGGNSKIVVLGDVRQMDNRYLTEKSNGLAVMSDKLLGKSFFSHITLSKSQRSPFIDEIDEAF